MYRLKMAKRPLKFKLDAYRFYAEGNNPIDSFSLSGKENGCALSGCMTTKAYASGYMSDDIKNVLRRKIAAGDPEVLAYFKQHGLDLI